MDAEFERMLVRIREDLESRVEYAIATLEKAAADSFASQESVLAARRIAYVLRIATAHADRTSPLRSYWPPISAEDRPKVEEDIVWCDQVILAIKNGKARPAHPNADLEEILQVAFAT